MSAKTIWHYRVKHDTGFAPNPFGGVCSLAVCTPNHQGCRVQASDWIVGIVAKSVKNLSERLLFAMQVDETLGFNDYYADPRFETKKPKAAGLPSERCGDNIYFLDSLGHWQQDKNTPYHKELLEKDCKYPRVFLSRTFWYFGDQAIELPHEFEWLKRVTQGCWKNKTNADVIAFENWICAQEQTGQIGRPINFGDVDNYSNIVSIDSIL